MIGFVLHLSACLTMAHIRAQDPQDNLRVTSSSKAIILYGYNSWGFTTIKLFDQWSDLAKYMNEKKLSLPPLAAAYLPQVFNVKLEALNPGESLMTDNRSQKHKVLRKKDGGPNKVIITPDLTTAQIFKEYAFYVGIQTGSLGYSLPLSRLKSN